jgi:hypothetical protein
MIHDDCGAIRGMNEWEENRSTRRQSAPEPLCPSQISHGFTRCRIRPVAVESRRQTAAGLHSYYESKLQFHEILKTAEIH